MKVKKLLKYLVALLVFESTVLLFFENEDGLLTRSFYGIGHDFTVEYQATVTSISKESVIGGGRFERDIVYEISYRYVTDNGICRNNLYGFQDFYMPATEAKLLNVGDNIKIFASDTRPCLSVINNDPRSLFNYFRLILLTGIIFVVVALYSYADYKYS